MAAVIDIARSIVMVPLFLVATLVVALSVIAVAAVRRDAPIIDRMIGWWAGVFLAIAPIRFSVTGREHIDPTRPCIAVSNHLSNFDIPLLLAAMAPLRIRFLAKKELYRIPILAQAMRAAGIVRIDRQAGMTAHEAINRGVEEAMARGFSLMVFPEGTRSRTGELHRFKKGAFRMAVDHGLPVLPVAIHGTYEANRPGSWLIRRAHARVRVLPPVETVGMSVRDDATPLMKEVQEAVETTYEGLRRRAQDDGQS